ncbi:2-hydroxychromene-2-carboxylate isomerase [Quisquiliibacterium transsilvanicum]|uniref:2-hydroxychromene-2-carboxylate isomerase n=1 Tax=Quisquiliibacterium transsilvanicum TaxID=1549638 RepID=A0A7W8HET7_9BURK|nr:2-hydroxychromene-2-carboxylate isomerase [Quisquiliibacterium transsilvanicum]MBB5270729.1 2-hydroxychromene-2-carboxylate isomerase [Quisquiliibacterium transsilvanicum]
MERVVDYYMTPLSPWTFLGHGRLREICALHNATIRIKPIDLGARVLPAGGGVPLAQRSEQRKAYRLVELRRWSARREVPLNLHPKHFPVPADEACRLIIAAMLEAGEDAAFTLAGALMKGVWQQDRDVSDAHTLRAIAHEAGLDADALMGRIPDAHQVYEANTIEALERQVFGAPWYVFRDEPFWGQDRLEMLELSLARP